MWTCVFVRCGSCELFNVVRWSRFSMKYHNSRGVKIETRRYWLDFEQTVTWLFFFFFFHYLLCSHVMWCHSFTSLFAVSCSWKSRITEQLTGIVRFFCDEIRGFARKVTAADCTDIRRYGLLDSITVHDDIIWSLWVYAHTYIDTEMIKLWTTIK